MISYQSLLLSTIVLNDMASFNHGNFMFLSKICPYISLVSLARLLFLLLYWDGKKKSQYKRRKSGLASETYLLPNCCTHHLPFRLVALLHCLRLQYEKRESSRPVGSGSSDFGGISFPLKYVLRDITRT